MNKRLLNQCILIALALMFLMPGIAAYFFYKHPHLLVSSTVNKGVLLKPPMHLNALGKQNKWKLIVWQVGLCDKACLQQLDNLSRIRMALGRRFYDVDQWLLLDYNSPQMDSKVLSVLKQNHVYLSHLSSNENKQLASLEPNKVFIASPDNYLILSYDPGFNSKDIYTDLKLLLNTTQNKRE